MLLCTQVMKRLIIITAAVIIPLFLLHAHEVKLTGNRTHARILADEQSPFQRSLSRGIFLVAAEQLRDPNFSETVVVLLGYSNEGAMGLIVNRPTDVRLWKVFPEIRGLRRRRDTLYVGGPVGTDQLIVLVRSGIAPEDSYRIIDDVYVCSDLDVLQKIVKMKQGDEFRTYAGYAGWAPGQLDYEVMRGDWHIIRADAENIFTKEPDALWQELIQRSTAQWTKIDPVHDGQFETGARGSYRDGS